MRTVVFDLDGTLADTSADLIAAANSCFIALGHAAPLDPLADASTAFRGGRAMLRLGFERLHGAADDARIDAQYAPFLAAYEDGIDRETRLYPDAMETVTALRAAGYVTTICTNKPAALAETLMTRLGARHLFDMLIGADTLPVRKPDPAPYRAAVEGAGGLLTTSLLVGDTETDRLTARAAGVPCILVTFGPEGEGIRRLDADGYFAGYGALPAEITRLIG
ncbi:HAD-IA family hydrolase [Anianabacter salinae]|uniref:HAD-IA family hydrolase n=1 Tax=Anianabacter salinae TaxID=2851023 RepID=UPI00225E0950|nr:HAD-IA family hydrolase [Anianabacter salinae]MBV0911412.1 HAD-IA family hydrolase [Anianabacter salinae]